MRYVKSVLLLAMVVGACSDPVAPATVDGLWAEDFSIPGNSTMMELTADGGTVSGSGSWCGEAGPCGSISVSGTVNGSLVHLDLTFITTFPAGASGTSVQHFDGRVTAKTLRGSIAVERPGQPPFVGEVSYTRQTTEGLTPF